MALVVILLLLWLWGILAVRYSNLPTEGMRTVRLVLRHLTAEPPNVVKNEAYTVGSLLRIRLEVRGRIGAQGEAQHPFPSNLTTL